MFDLLLYLLIYFLNWTKEHQLKTSNKKTHIPSLINLFFSLIELKTSNKIIHMQI